MLPLRTAKGARKINQSKSPDYTDLDGLYAEWGTIIGPHEGPLAPIRPKREGCDFFEYCPVDPSRDQTRLLELFPGRYADEVRGRLFSVPCHDPPEYEALSYCWGSSKATEEIVLNYTEGFLVTSNLLDALRRLRFSGTSRVLWVDLICIDQANDTERAHQVRLMRLIYSRARRTVIWLGEDGVLYSSNRGRETLFGSDGSSEALGKTTAGRYLNDIVTGPFVSWFSRMWVIQEFALSEAGPLIGFGPYWLSFDVSLQLFKDYTSKLPNLDEMMDLRTMVQEDRSYNLRKLLDLTLGAEASVKHDKVYGLMGLARQTDTDRIRIDYELPLKQLCLDVARAILADDNTDDLLWMRCVRFRDLDELPSWMPDFCASSRERLSQVTDLRAGGDRPPDQRISSDGGVLATIGCPPDRICEMIIPGPLSWEFSQKIVNYDYTYSNSSLPPLCRGVPGPEAISVLPQHYVPEHLRKGSTVTCEEVHKEFREIWRRWRWLPSAQVREPTLMQKEEEWPEWRSSCWRVPPDRTAVGSFSLFRTEAGFVGFGRAQTEVGDLLAVIRGSKLPYILQRVEDHFVLVGEALVPGLMSGKAMEGDPNECGYEYVLR